MKFIKIVSLLFFFLPLSAQAVGTAINPSSLDFLYPDKKEATLVVKNISLEPIVVYIYPDEYKGNIRVVPQEINLLPEEYGKIQVIIDFSKDQTGVRSTHISVVSKAVDKRSFNAASGLKIPLSVSIHKEPWRWSGSGVFVAVFFALFLTALLIQSIFLLLRPRKKENWRNLNFLSFKKRKRFFNK